MVGRERLGKRAGPLSVKKENYFRGGGGNYLPPNSSYKKTQPPEIALTTPTQKERGCPIRVYSVSVTESKNCREITQKTYFSETDFCRRVFPFSDLRGEWGRRERRGGKGADSRPTQKKPEEEERILQMVSFLLF